MDLVRGGVVTVTEGKSEAAADTSNLGFGLLMCVELELPEEGLSMVGTGIES